MTEFNTYVLYRVISFIPWTCPDTMERIVTTLCESCSGYDRNELIEAASRSRLRLPLHKYFIAKRNDQSGAFSTAMRHGDLAAVQYWLDETVENKLRVGSFIFWSSYCGSPIGNSAVALLLLSKNLCVALIVRWAAEYRMMDVIRFAHQNGLKGFTYGAMDIAAAAGSLPMVQFLHEHRHEGCSTKAMDSAAAEGYLHVVKFLHEHRDEGCTSCAMDLAAKHGHVRVVKFLQENRQEGCTEKALVQAAKGGHLEILQYLWHNQQVTVEVQQQALNAAKSKAQWHVVYWLAGTVDAQLEFADCVEYAEKTQCLNPDAMKRLLARLRAKRSEQLDNPAKRQKCQ